MNETDITSFDEAWNHCSNGTKLLETLCNSNRKTVIGFSIIEPESRLFTSFHGSSKALGAETCREPLDMIKSPRITRGVTDGDVVRRKTLRTAGSNIKQLVDIGQVVKSFIRKFNSVNARQKKILESFGESLLRHF
jgi:hypothetical protein